MGDMRDYYKDHSEHYKDVRESCFERRIKIIKEKDWNHEVFNNCKRVRIQTPNGPYDVWPGTGKWNKVGTSRYFHDWGDFVREITKVLKQEAK